eukprot:CAMPEP_0178431588 /NCGR_PEP_ID=MMETSP0689_2-20121128/31932_1 /TAXON_ID=160604 /ORGANISM="Amphidinium massartii, Strain CS-259" /LENGTH=161 /DNA_ID=CAMNT_0020053519 /DNA_START=94 /DNA_END=576 /DNA_ORIENTATION=-
MTAQSMLGVTTLHRALCLCTNCTSPSMVMQSSGLVYGPARGDVLLVSGLSSGLVSVGDLLLFRVADRNVSIVHRALAVHEQVDGVLYFLTKGDDNAVDDRGLYPAGQLFLRDGEVVGRIYAVIPYVGIPKLLFDDSLGSLAFVVPLLVGVVMQRRLLAAVL